MVIANQNFYFHHSKKENIMSKGTVKWFNAEKGFGLTLQQTAAKIYLFTILKFNLAAVMQH
jgi:hypothetical protein